MKKGGKRWWLIFGLATFGLLALGFLHLLIDEPPPEDDDLRPRRVEVPEAENGFLVVNFRPGEVFKGSDSWKYQPFEADWDSRAAEEVVKKNSTSLEKFDKSLGFPRFQVPEIKDLNHDFPYIQTWNFLIDAAVMRLGLLFEQGKESDAFGEALKITSFGHRVSGSDGSLLVYLFGLGTQCRGIDLLMKLMSRTKLPAEEVRPFFEGLEGFRLQREDFAEAMKGDYLLIVLILDGIDRNDDRIYSLHPELRGLRSNRLSRMGFQVNSTKRLFSEMFRCFIHDIFEGRFDFKKSFAVTVHPWLPPMNVVGKTLYQIRASSMNSSLMARFLSADFFLSAAKLKFALWSFNKKKGVLPQSLEELVPEYLKEIPLDPIDGKPIRYSKEKRILYSEEALNHQLEPAIEIDF